MYFQGFLNNYFTRKYQYDVSEYCVIPHFRKLSFQMKFHKSNQTAEIFSQVEP